MAIKSLREWLAVIDKEGKLKRVSRDVKLEYELIAVAKKASSKYAVLFERPVGDTLREDNRMPVVANTMVSREDFSKLLGVPVIELADCLMRAQDNPIAPVIVDKEKSPAKEVVIKDVNLYDLPIPVNHLGDNGAFVTAGVIVARDPATGKRNVSIHRMQLRDEKHLGIFMLPKHLDEFQRSAEKQNRPLEVTVSIGLDPILMLASQVTAPLGFDEFGVAGALYGSGLELVAGETVGVEAPANAEIIIEGKIIPHVRESEGPFGEYPQYYSPQTQSQVVEVTCITMRREAIYQTVVPAAEEHFLLGAIARESRTLKMVREVAPNVRALQLGIGGNRRSHLVIQIDKKNDGEVRNAMFAAFSSNPEIKHIVAVDTDVDLFNSIDVLWAVATRCQADRDIFIVPGAQGSTMDPSAPEGVGAKMGIDATAPVGSLEDEFKRIENPYDGEIELEEYFN